MTEPNAQPIRSAAELRAEAAAREAERARQAQAEAEAAAAARKAEIEALQAATLDQDRSERIRDMIRHAVAAGALEVELMRFPIELTTDKGRAINNNEPDWPDTLTGLPADLARVWRDRLKDEGYHLKAMVTAFPDGMPGEAALILSWAATD